MKRIQLSLMAAAALFAVSCEGPQGPPGFDGLDGLDGQDGVNILGTVFDVTVDFTAANNYEALSQYPSGVEVFESDVVLVYLLFEEATDDNGQAVDVWRLLPQTRLLDQGILIYNYDFTFADYRLFLETDFDPASLLPGDALGQTFRIAVVPAEFGSTGRLDVSDIEAVMQAMGVTEDDVLTID